MCFNLTMFRQLHWKTKSWGRKSFFCCVCRLSCELQMTLGNWAQGLHQTSMLDHRSAHPERVQPALSTAYQRQSARLLYHFFEKKALKTLLKLWDRASLFMKELMQPIEPRSQNAQANFHSIRLAEQSCAFAWKPLGVPETILYIGRETQRRCRRLAGVGEEAVVKSNKAFSPLSSPVCPQSEFYVRLNISLSLVDSV